MEGCSLTSASSVNATKYVINQSMTDVQREPAVSISDNDKATILQQQLQQYRIALEVMEHHPSVLQEFKERLSRRCKQKQTQLTAVWEEL